MTKHNISHLTHFVRGFAQSEGFDEFTDPSNCHGNFIAVITDLQTTFSIDIKSACKNHDNTWTIECLDGNILILAPELSRYRKLIYAGLVKISEPDNKYKIITSQNYDTASQAISNGDRTFRLIGYAQNDFVQTSPLKKLWTDSNGNNHALTISNSHYIF